MAHICTDDSLNAGVAKEDLEFTKWCPYCDEITKFSYIVICSDEVRCTICDWRPSWKDNWPEGLDENTGELIDEV